VNKYRVNFGYTILVDALDEVQAERKASDLFCEVSPSYDEMRIDVEIDR
jgi:hypothetical protein